MRPDTQIFRPRFEMLCREVIGPAIYPDRAGVEVGCWASEERWAYARAVSASYEPVRLPHAWGPAWSTQWFRLSGMVPDRFDGREIHLRFDPGTEATVWKDGHPVRGLDENRDWIGLGLGRGGDRVEFLVEAACNHPFGDQVFNWDSRERGERWKSATPGLVTRAEIAVFDRLVWELHRRMQFAFQLLTEVDPLGVRAQDLYACMRRAADAVDDRDVGGTAARALAELNRGLERSPAGSAPRLVCVGHAHIDTAWLWTLSETRRKTVRSWTNTLDLMDRDPDLHFMCSQPQQYAWLEQDAPGVFDRIRTRVQEGRWEPVGSMWVETDALVPSGESLVRQVLHGVGYFESRFGDRGRQRVVYLPDTFGFPACMPTVMRACGLDVFVTNKLSWNQANAFPHTSFRWRGMDGSEVLAHNTPGGDYNATLTPKELRRATANIRGRDAAGLTGPAVALQPFGYGDGGGGPTMDMLERARAAGACEELPRTVLGSVAGFLTDLEEEDRRVGGLPVWCGPLDLELHRGVLTTHAWLKQANHRAERALREVELAVVSRLGASDTGLAEGWRAKLDEAWKLVLLNQFHDILPGSSVAAVYEDARGDYGRVQRLLTEVLGEGEEPERAANDGMVVVNTGSSTVSGLVEHAGVLRWTMGVGPMDVGVFDVAGPTREQQVRVEPERVVRCGSVWAAFGEHGQLNQLGVGEHTRVRAGDWATSGRSKSSSATSDDGLLRLRMYEDRPMNWDAWDIDLDYERNLVWEDTGVPDSFEIHERDGLRGDVVTRRKIGAGSTLTQTIRFDAGAGYAELLFDIDWRERHRILRAEVCPAILTDRVTVGTQYGYVTRPTHRNTGWDRFGFEFAGHGWVDMAEPGRGLSLLADSSHGFSAHGARMGVSLLRSSTHPDPEADQGPIRLRLGLLAHQGDWRAAGVDQAADRMHHPLRAVSGKWKEHRPPCRVVVSPGGWVEISAVKPAEDGGGATVVRLVERRGMHTRAVVTPGVPSTVIRCDALERPKGVLGVSESVLEIRPFEIVTLRLEPLAG